jgi:hypothetical protein
MPQLLSHRLPPFSVRAGITGPFPATFCGAGHPLPAVADNAKMTAILPARKRILYGNTIWKRPPYRGSAYAFLVLPIRFYEGVRLTHQTNPAPVSDMLTLSPQVCCWG